MDMSSYMILLVALSQICDAYRILIIFPFPGRSHGILGEGYVKHLLEAGHEVTYITPFPLENSNPKLHQVDVSANIEDFQTDMMTLKAIIDKELDIDTKSVLPKIMSLSTMTIKNANVQAMLNDPRQTFDVVIGEWMLNEVYSGFAAVYNCPFIWSSSIEPHWMILRLIHEASNPAFNPDVFSTAIPPFDFLQRVKSLLGQIFITALKIFYVEPTDKAIYEEIFGPIVTNKGRKLPPYEEVMYNASMVLSNSYVAMGQPISLPPNSKEIGGYHIDTNMKPLPQDLQKVMDEAKDGVIYFSLGSNVKSKDFPEVLKKDILEMLGGLQQTIIWKFEEDLPDKPTNIHIRKWAPQPSILGHPNCRLFITHGGLLSTTETMYFGVPTIVIPTAGDQFLNAGRAVSKGFALKVDLSYEMAREMKVAIEEVLNNPKYKETITELSKIYHDRPVSPGRELVHWVEHVVKTRGAPHLRSPALMLPWYQKAYLDLLAIVIAGNLMLIFVFKRILFSKKGIDRNKKNK